VLLCYRDAILAVLLFLVTIGRNEHALQNRCLPDRRLVLRRFLHGRRLGDCRLARRADLLRDLNRSKQGRHSITSSARIRNDWGMVRPRAFTVFRLMMKPRPRSRAQGNLLSGPDPPEPGHSIKVDQRCFVITGHETSYSSHRGNHCFVPRWNRSQFRPRRPKVHGL